MSWKCLFKPHDWDNCKCRRCEQTRNEGHDWDKCKCKRCGEIRNEDHDWELINNVSSEECIGWHGESPYMADVSLITYRCRKCGTEKNEKHIDSFSLGSWIEEL